MTDEGKMGFIDHLEEVRSRLIISIVAILVTTALAYIFSDAILAFLSAPVTDINASGLVPFGGAIKLVGFSPMDGFMIRFRVALYGGLVLAAPIWIYQLMRFIEPGLLPHERRVIIPAVVAAVVLFLLGNTFGYLMLKNMMGALFFMFGSELTYVPSADQYISFVTYFLVGVGVAFELPLIMLVLMRLGLVSPQWLRKQRKIAYFIIFVFAEVITPVSDPLVAPTVVMMPMVALFELALIGSRFIVPKPVTAVAAPEVTSK